MIVRRLDYIETEIKKFTEILRLLLKYITESRKRKRYDRMFRFD